MKPLCVAIGATALLLSACAANPGPTAGQGVVYGYQYHDGRHPNDVNSQPSPQAIENARQGVWLWPPDIGRRS